MMAINGAVRRGGVSREQIERAKAVPLLDYILSHEGNNFKRVGNAYYRRDPDHNSLEVSNNLWNWHSHGVGGDIIDYLVKMNGYSFVDAVRELAGDDYTYTRAAAPKVRPPNAYTHSVRTVERKPFSLPPRSADNSRVIAYLQKRGIDKALIEDCIKRGIVYESSDYHNAVFVGRDESGKARFAAMRGTYGDFKSDATGSDKSYGFCLPCFNPESRAVAVFESPIDALSHVFLEPRFDGWRLSLGGTALAALSRFYKTHNEIERVVACTDNDDAGERAAAKIFEMFDNDVGVEITRSCPPVGKDWNETLLYTQSEVKVLEDKRKEIRFITSSYNELFRIKDGDSIRFTSGYDGTVSTAKCRWIDEAHTRIGGEHYHICQWAEICERNGHKVEAAKPENKIDILTAKYGESLREVSVPMTEAALKRLVGGKFEKETLCYPSQTTQFRDKIVVKEGKAFGAVLRGKDGVAVCGLRDGVLTSLHPYNAQTVKRDYGVIEAQPPQSPRHGDLLGKVGKFKEKVAEQHANAADRSKERGKATAEIG